MLNSISFVFFAVMEPLPDRKKVDEALDRICADQLFKRSHINELLLRFLVEQAYKGTDVKEQVIGLELFKHDYSPESNDSKIRVSIFYLRKKLNSYYAGSGSEEEIRFTIEKGQYNLKFKENTRNDERIDQNSSSTHLKIRKKYLVYAGLFAFGVMVVIAYNNFKPLSRYCWQTFFNSDSPTICVVADHFVVKDMRKKDFNVYSLYSIINNESDFITYNEHNSGDSLRLGNFTMFSKMAPLAIQNLTKWFYLNKSEFSIQLESELRYEDVKEKNMLYIGQYKNMNLSESLFLKNSKIFRAIRDGYVHFYDDKEVVYESGHSDKTFLEYAMVSYVPNEHGKDALFFVSNHDIGVMATVKNFTDMAWLAGFYDKLPKGTNYFNALFAVEGLQRTVMECKLVEFEAISDK